MGFWRKLWRTQSEYYIAEYINAGPSVKKEQEYLTIDLEGMHIVNVRKGLTKFHGAVHSNIGVPYITGGVREFQLLATPPDLGKADAKNLDRVIPGPFRLLDGVPFRGGKIDLEVGLFSIAAADLAAPYLELLGDLSEKAGVAFVSTAMPFVEILHKGFKAIAGNDALEIGRAALFDPPHTGHYIVIQATHADFPRAKFTVSNDGRELLADGKSVDRPYMILRFHTSPARDDWFLIPELSRAYEDICVCARKNDYPGVEKSLTAFEVIAGTCPDLLHTHAESLAKKIKSEFQALMQARLTAPTEPPKPKPLRAFNPFH
jgi:hypothetical protein